MSMKKSLSDIPVVVAGRQPASRPSQKLHWQRRAFQYGVLALLVIIPLTRLFRIDPIQGAFVVLGRQIWFSDFSIVFGFWIIVACCLAMLYSVMGTVFCGWACPQNTLSEWANNLTFKLLGKRAEVSLDGTPMQISQVKNKPLNWLILFGLSAVVAALVALIPLFYFYEPLLIWRFVSFQYDPGLAPSLHWIYLVFLLVILVDIVMIRHFMCRFMCIYKVWQHTFKTKQTLHIAYDESRKAECEKCNYCVTSCFLAIDPRKTDLYDTCINCGECVTACENLHTRKGKGESLLRFAMGERQGTKAGAVEFKTNMHNLFSRASWAFPILVVGLGMFIWGLWSYERYHFAVYRADTLQAAQILDYRISLANKFYEPARLHVTVEGLSEDQYTLAAKSVEFETAGRINLELKLSPALAKGLYPILVRVKSEDGWEESFRVQHFSAGALS
jgi:polyferredoxin